MPPKPRGGKRPGAGRKPVGQRCACGKHSLKRAARLRLRCGDPVPRKQPDHNMMVAQARSLVAWIEGQERAEALGFKPGPSPAKKE